MKKLKKLIFKVIWLIIFKIKNNKSPKFIITSFEHKELNKYIKNINLIIDIGFNKGQFSSLALVYWPGTKLIAFDPHPYASMKASKDLKRAYKNLFEFRNIGISSENANTKILYIAKKSDNSSLVKPTKLNVNLFSQTKIESSFICKVNKLENEINPYEYKKDWLIKIDVQGSELDVLKSISNDQFSNIKWIYIEVTNFLLYLNQASSHKIDIFLKSKGFQLINKFNQNRFQNELLYSDYLYCRIE